MTRAARGALLLVVLSLCACPGEETLRVVPMPRDMPDLARPDAGEDSTSDLDGADISTSDMSSMPFLDMSIIEDSPADLSEDSAPDLIEDIVPDLRVKSACPSDMVQLDAVCMDRYEAPNVAGELPLVMYTFLEAEAWCAARDKRLCFDDEWRGACAGRANTAYPYGAAHRPGICRDEARWRAYNQTLLNGWPAGASGPQHNSLDALLADVRTRGAAAQAAADHIEALYQGAGSGQYAGCTNETGVMDLTGNVEEWTRRRDGGMANFHGNLKGRYWAETRTCQSNITTHGDTFRFYEIGFRCCRDLNL
jgi:hypothetical protein